MEVPAGARLELERMARSSVLPHRQVVQAKALLALADGWSVRSTAKELGTYPNTVAAWRDRFLAAGVDGVGGCVGEASAILWGWSTCPERRDRRWTG